MSFRKYESYRESGVEWVGLMPSHWQVKPLLAVAPECGRPNRGMIESNLLSLSYGRIVRKNINDNDGLLPQSFETYQIVEPNDIVWRLTDLQNDKRSLRTALVEERGIITSAYLATAPGDIHPRYLNYLLRAYDLQKVFYSMGGGIRQGMNFSDVKRLPILVPPAPEQIDISDFLDRETAAIDALVLEQRKFIQLLAEKRQAIISHAVTRGIDPSAPMKDSQIKWLGNIPAHWNVKRVKHIADKVVDCLHTTPTYDGELRYPAIRTADVGRGTLRLEQARLVSREIYEERIQRLRPEAGDILYSREGERFGMAALVPPGVELCLGQRMMMFRLKSEFEPDYFMWSLNSESVFQQVLETVGGATSPHINISDIVNFFLPVPPPDEQQQISASVRKQVHQIDQLLMQAERTNRVLDERRAALISAAVTGALDVRATGALSQSVFDSQQARLLVGAAIVEAMANKPSSGRTKTHKIVFLTEVHAGVHELAGVYQREAAGPLDTQLIEDMEGQFQKVGHVSVEQPGGHGRQVTYTVCGKRDRFRNQLDRALGARAKVMNKLIADLGELDTKSVEAVATLYAVWNDALLDGHSPSDDAIVAGVLDDWHPEKRQKFTAQQLHIWLGWMRRHAVVPEGRAPKTTRGRLFA